METEAITVEAETIFVSDLGANFDGLAPEGEERPVIPQAVYDGLPGLLRDVCEYFPVGHERDLFLTGALIECSGILSAVKFPHYDKWYHLNLYALVTADTGSGKGGAALAEKLGEVIEKRLDALWVGAVEEWKAKRKEIEAIKQRNREHSRKKEELEDVPELEPQPLRHTLSIAANSSARGFIDRLLINGGEGIVFETETLTLLINRKQDWGETDAYLKGFHNEPFKLDRKGGECIRIPLPRFSAFLTGTLEATKAFLPSAEDGLFSRFLHYWFKAPVVWRSQRPTTKSQARDTAISGSAQTLDSLHQLLVLRQEREEGLFVWLSDAQWNAIDALFGGTTDALSASNSNLLLHANVRRAALVAARIACIFAVLRHFERGLLGDQKSIPAGNEDIACALMLARTYLAHAIELAKVLKVSANANLSGAEANIYGILPEQPGSITVKQIATLAGFDERKVQRNLRKLRESDLAHAYTEKGPYARGTLSNLSHVTSVVSVTFDASIDDPPEPGNSNTTETTNTTCDNFEIPF